MWSNIVGYTTKKLRTQCPAPPRNRYLIGLLINTSPNSLLVDGQDGCVCMLWFHRHIMLFLEVLEEAPFRICSHAQWLARPHHKQYNGSVTHWDPATHIHSGLQCATKHGCSHNIILMEFCTVQLLRSHLNGRPPPLGLVLPGFSVIILPQTWVKETSKFNVTFRFKNKLNQL